MITTILSNFYSCNSVFLLTLLMSQIIVDTIIVTESAINLSLSFCVFVFATGHDNKIMIQVEMIHIFYFSSFFFFCFSLSEFLRLREKEMAKLSPFQNFCPKCTGSASSCQCGIRTNKVQNCL